MLPPFCSSLVSFCLLSCVGAAPSTFPGANTTNPIAELWYGSFEGAYSAPYNITYFTKIPFAAPPVGINRFRAPQPVIPITNGIYNSTQSYAECPQRTMNGSEDCLYLGLYSRPWTTGSKLRPVLLDIYGGAYIEGGGSFTIPPPAWPVLNASSENDYILVYPNYRLNSFGFLPGREVAEDPYSDLNVGLLDQHAVLKWVNRNIKAFGGDPNNVTIWGQSAGGGSVLAQSIANPTYQRGLITRTLGSSPFTPKMYRYDSPEAESIYQSFAALVNCSGPRSLACLKRAPLQSLITASLAISGSHTYNTSSYTWAPVVDDSFINLPLSQASGNIAANLKSAWGMYNTHEGQNFVPPGLQNTTNVGSTASGYFNSSTASFDQWVTGFLPKFTPSQIHTLITKYYPPSGSTEEISFYNDSFTRAGLIYRDIVLACPTYWLASSTKQGYVGEYTISPATHGSDTEWWDQVTAIEKADPLIYDGFTGAFASYFGTGDPNAHKLTNSSEAGVPELGHTRGKGNQEFVIESAGFVTTGIQRLESRCAFWKSNAKDVPV